MPTAANVLGITAGAYSGLVGVFARPSRKLGPLVADAVLEEFHEDELTLTDHPIQYGSVITDHAFKLPSRVTLTYGWSQSPSSVRAIRETVDSVVQGVQTADTLSGIVDTLYGTGRINSYYRRLRDLQLNREVFTIITGRLKYENMMLVSLSLVTDKDTENALIVRAVCREVQFADTVTTRYGDVMSSGTLTVRDVSVTPDELNITVEATGAGP